MFFDFALTVPANTAASSPTTLDVQLPPGTVHHVDVLFPAGCVGLVHTYARRGAHQVWPSNEGGSFATNGQTISWEEEYDLDDAPFTLRLHAYNLDDFYAHTVTWRFALRPFTKDAQARAAAAAFKAYIAQLEVDV